MNLSKITFLFVMAFFLFGCSNSSPPSASIPVQGEFVFRRQNENFVQVEPMIPLKRVPYPWEEQQQSKYPKITKDFFRCKGSSLNPVRLAQKEKEVVRYYDCGGPQKHSLPLRNEKEFIYEILIDILNYIQTQVGKRVVITCGHCCPEHNLYLDPSPSNQVSKHLLGAEVDFYVEGMEKYPEKIVEWMITYYREQPKYHGLKEYEFKRYEKDDTNVVTTPWYNKEIFIKVFKKEEGRDFDNRHPYPYVSIQVRHDSSSNKKVVYSWEKAFHNFLRW